MANHDNYVIQGNTLDAIASEVKTLAEISDKISPNEMSEKLAQTNADISTQADIIAQIQTALEGKAASSGGGTEEIENLIDQSGVLDSTEGTIEEKVEQLIDLVEKNPLQYMTLENDTNLFGSANFPENYHCFLRVKGTETTMRLSRSFQSSNVKKVTLKIDVLPATLKMSIMFSGCKNLTEITFENNPIAPYWLDDTFNGCILLETINGQIDGSKCVTFADAFRGCNKLREIYFVPETIKVSITIPSPVLSNESIISIINGLATVETAQTLTLNAEVKAKLTETQLATITNKNWNLA